MDLRRRGREPYTKRKSVTILIIGLVGLALAFTPFLRRSYKVMVSIQRYIHHLVLLFSNMHN